jgi:prepilin-type N-terminal cleavage/methylation domain-containing protein
MKKGFTLIELVIVIGILAILAVVAILVLNPAQMLAQARDSQRVSDLGSIKSAVALYLANTSGTPAVAAGPRATFATTCAFGTSCIIATSSIDGTGWVAVDLANTNGGSPLSALPLDPVNSATLQYAYKGDATNLTFELDGVLESTKYIPMMSTDGGDNNSYYEVGTDSGLNL